MKLLFDPILYFCNGETRLNLICVSGIYNEIYISDIVHSLSRIGGIKLLDRIPEKYRLLFVKNMLHYDKNTSLIKVINKATKAVVLTEVSPINFEEEKVTLALKENADEYFYGENIFRMFQDNVGGTLRDPEAKPEAKILVENPRRPVTSLNIVDANNQIIVSTAKIDVQVDKNTSLITVVNKATKAVVT